MMEPSPAVRCKNGGIADEGFAGMSILRRMFGYVALAVVLAAAAAFAYAWRSPLAPADVRRTPANQAAVEQGAVLAAIGNCATCHTSDETKPFAGGRAIETPFGRIHATNITPDGDTGIGHWSEAAFVRAVKEGVSADGSHLYPAFPYDHMARATDSDIKAVYDFLMTRRAIRSVSPPNEIAFPYNIRMLIAGWKLLYHSSATYQQVAGKGAEWNRGAYLVEGLAHCGSCHTPRNDMGAEIKSNAYGGGSSGGWTAPALNARSPAAAPWTAERVFNYLSRGSDGMHGTVTGPMAPVVHNLAAVPDSDLRAISLYVADIAAAANVAEGAAGQAVSRARTAAAQASGIGAQIYAGACASCHGEAGRTPRDPALSLALSSAVRVDDPGNLVRIIRDGISTPLPGAGGYMPPFGAALTANQTTELVKYLRATFTERAPFGRVEETVTQSRRGS